MVRTVHYLRALCFLLCMISCHCRTMQEISYETMSLLHDKSPSFFLDHDQDVTVKPENITNRCRSFLNEFSKHTGEFVRCTVDHSRPFRICTSCVDKYQKAKRIYDDIHTDDETKGGCKALLLDSDRMQVLDQIHKNIHAIWTDAVCKDCFSSIEEYENGTVKFTLNQEVLNFITLYDNTSKCIHDHLNTSSIPSIESDAVSFNKSVCQDCRPHYKSLNSYFVNMQTESSFHVCMDLVDMMNYTRLMWGGGLQCTRSYKDDMKIALIGLIMGMLPIIFYMSGKMCGGRKEIKFMTQKRMSKKAREFHYGNYRGESEEDNSFEVSDTRPLLNRGNRIILPPEAD